MCKIFTGRNATVATPIRTEQEADPVAPKVDADAIRRNVASLARERGEADKVLDTVIKNTTDNSYDYARATVRESQEGIETRLTNGRVVNDYSPNAEGRPQFDFSETQDIVAHSEQSVQSRRGLLGRTRQHVVQQQVQTLVSEKVRFDFNLSEKLDVKVGQNDTVFVNGSVQQGHKDIHLHQKDGGGSLALVLGGGQSLKDISFDANRNVATIVLDNAVLTVHGVTNPNALVIGRDRGTQGATGFVSATTVAEMLLSGRQELLATDKKFALELFSKGKDAFSAVQKAAGDMARANATKQKESANGAAPSGNAPATDLPETVANKEPAKATLEQPARTEIPAANEIPLAVTPSKIEKRDRRADLRSLRNEVELLIEQKGEVPLTKREFNTAVMILKRTNNGELPQAEEVAQKICDSRRLAEEARRNDAQGARTSDAQSEVKVSPPATDEKVEPAEVKPILPAAPVVEPTTTKPATTPSAEQSKVFAVKPTDTKPAEMKPTQPAPLVNAAPPSVKPAEVNPVAGVTKPVEMKPTQPAPVVNPAPPSVKPGEVKPAAGVTKPVEMKPTQPAPVANQTPSDVESVELKPATGQADLSGTKRSDIAAPTAAQAALKESKTLTASAGGKTAIAWKDVFESTMNRLSNLTASVQGTTAKSPGTAAKDGAQVQGAPRTASNENNAPMTEPVRPLEGPSSPTQAALEKQYRDAVAGEKIINDRLKNLKAANGAVDADEVTKLHGSRATFEQEKEFAADRAKLAAGQRAAFDLLSEKIKLMEKWEAQGITASDLESFRAHHSRLGKALGYSEDFIKQSIARDAFLAPVSVEDLKFASESTTGVTKEILALETKVSKKWNDRLLSSAERFKAEVPGSAWAKNNPMKALTTTLVLSEAVTGALRADYSSDAKHSAIPSLIGLMSQDVATWGQFTTKERGLVASVAAEATQKGLDAGTVMGAFYALDKVVSNTVGRTAVGEVVGARLLGAVGLRALGVAGVAYHGYSTFSDGSFEHMNNTQLAGAVASPILGGAAVGGAVAGPPGAGAGAIVGAVSEGVGVAVGYMRIEADFIRNSKKQSVRDSLRLAAAGFVRDDSIAAERKLQPLSAEAAEVITHQARAGVLSHIITSNDPAQIKALGFRQFESGVSPASQSAVAEHNWNRMVELTVGDEREQSGQMVLNERLQAVSKASPSAAAEFVSNYKKAKGDLTDLYQRSIRITRSADGSEVGTVREINSIAANVVNSVNSEMSKLEVLAEVHKNFPGLAEILKHENSRELLINRLEFYSENSGRYRRILELEEAAQGLVAAK